ncbi:MAG: SH3 domain-containing protein, partial [Planctomycetaceae bacterium]
MHRTLILTSLILLSTGSLLEAQNAQFPYDAEIVAAEAYVRSGPGKKYYPTSILKRNERVVVRRHDPGGWYMIDPPVGSFSWVRADYIEKNGNVGTVTETNVVARVGSAVNPDSKEVEQIRLSQGDDVQILGEKAFNIDGKSIPFYKIEPPRFEYRWIMGQFLIPVDSSLRRERAKNPFDAPPKSDLTDDSIPASEASQQISESDDQPAQLDKRILDPEESADDVAT